MKPICRHLHHQSKSPSKNCLIYFEKQYKQRGMKFFVWGRFPVPKSYRRSSSNNLLNIQRVNTLSGNKFFFSSAQKKRNSLPNSLRLSPFSSHRGRSSFFLVHSEKTLKVTFFHLRLSIYFFSCLNIWKNWLDCVWILICGSDVNLIVNVFFQVLRLTIEKIKCRRSLSLKSI